MFRGSGYRFGAKNIRQSAHVPAKWVPVRRQEHPPISACSGEVGTGSPPRTSANQRMFRRSVSGSASKEHAPTDESRAARPRKPGGGDFPQAAREVKVAAATGARG